MSTIKILAVLGVAGWMYFGNHAHAQSFVNGGVFTEKTVLPQPQPLGVAA